MPKKKQSAKARKAADNQPVLVKPTKVNGIEDAEAAAAMAPKKIKVPAKKSAKTKKKSAKTVHPKAKITFRHNFLPPLIGIIAFLEVLAILNFQWVSAQYQYYFSEPVSATSFSAEPENTDPNAPAAIYIPGIDVSAPVVTDVKSYNANDVQKALERGALQYGASANPGQKGNLVIVGHSSGQLWTPGSYKFVFTMLNKLQKDDRILVDYKGERYVYRVTGKEVVPPTDISVLQPTTEPQLTLITCTPVGTSKDRLIITARQVSPDPATATEIDPATIKPVTSSYIPN